VNSDFSRCFRRRRSLGRQAILDARKEIIIPSAPSIELRTGPLRIKQDTKLIYLGREATRTQFFIFFNDLEGKRDYVKIGSYC
jgi:hypothetical protein